MTYYRYYLLVINKNDNMSFYHKLLLRINGLSYSFDLLILVSQMNNLTHLFLVIIYDKMTYYHFYLLLINNNDNMSFFKK